MDRNNSIRSICYVVAMEAEARPLVEEFGLRERPEAFAPLPCKLYEGILPRPATTRGGDPRPSTIGGETPRPSAIEGVAPLPEPSEVEPPSEGDGRLRLYVVTNGQQHGSDLVGCEAASVATTMAISHLHPDLIINSGTCGAFARRGAGIGKVYIGHTAMFHDRRVPGDDAWHTQSLGDYPAWQGSELLARELGLPMGKVTTGSSLDMQPCDLRVIEEHGGELKDMEGAAVGFVASLYSVPVLYVKAVTDLLDSPAPTYQQFTLNLTTATAALRQANRRVVAALARSLRPL